jgi:hypothetical protein
MTLQADPEVFEIVFHKRDEGYAFGEIILQDGRALCCKKGDNGPSGVRYNRPHAIADIAKER